MKYNILRICTFIMYSLLVTTVCAQNILTEQTNMIREVDKLKMQMIEPYSLSLDDGESVVWDFSDVSILPGERSIDFSCDTLMQFRMYDDEEIYGYIFRSGILQKMLHENRLGKVIYDKPILSMAYPFQYGDTLSLDFQGRGVYCKNHLINETGQVLINADGCGMIVMSDNDTLKNVLRVYTITSTSIAMDMDSIALDTAKVKQEIEEKYDWYVRGYRYPLFEIVQRTSYSNMTPVASRLFAYRIVLDSLSINFDLQNDSVQNVDAKQLKLDELRNKDIFHYTVSQKGNNIDVAFSADEDVTIVGIISNVRGFVYRNIRTKYPADENQVLSFDCSGLPNGQYMLYLNVNGKVYSEKVTL